MKKRMTNIWVEELRLLDALYLFFPALLSAVTVYYDEHALTIQARAFLKALRGIHLSRGFCPVRLSLEKKDEKGQALNYRLEDNLEAALERFCKKYIPDEQEYLVRALKSYMSKHLFFCVTFITMVEYMQEFRQAGCRNIIYLADNPLISVIKPLYRDAGYEMRGSVSLFRTFKFYLRPFYLSLLLGITRFLPRKVSHNIERARPSIWVEHCSNALVDFTFWSGSINTADYDIVYYLDRDDDPLTPETTAAISKRGFRWIDLHFKSLVKLASLPFPEIWENLRCLMPRSFASPLWLGVFRFEHRMFLQLYRAVFKRFNARVVIQHQEFSWIQQAQASAAELCGGIMVGFHWSHFPYVLEPLNLTPGHVYFVWGRENKRWIQEKGNTCRYILPSGLWINNDRKDENLERFSRSLDFVISVFDSSVAYNIYNSPDSLVAFYSRILSLLEGQPRWGAIVKSKNWDLEELEALPEGGEIAKRMRVLIQGRRLVFLKKETSILEAAAYSRLCVCFSLNSAGIIAGVHGYRAIHWDCSGWLRHPFYRDPQQQFVYTDLDQLEDAIIRSGRGDERIGDFSAWAGDYNYFGDFFAPARIGKFIQSYMEWSAVTDDAERALSSAVKDYLDANQINGDFLK